jgi:hypothetical protein
MKVDSCSHRHRQSWFVARCDKIFSSFRETATGMQCKSRTPLSHLICLVQPSENKKDQGVAMVVVLGFAS